MGVVRVNNAIAYARHGLRIWRMSGTRGVAQRVARAAYKKLDAASLEFPLELDDVADSRHLCLPTPTQRVDRARPLRIGWVTTPPGLGSGGHTTMFRMVTALEDAGHECTMFLYDRYGSDLRRREAIIRRGWPSVRARVMDVRDGINDVDACVATSWQTAHVLARRGTAPMRRLYFVQDFEPFFYPRGAEYALAEDSYRFGFGCITIGHMLANLLHERFGIVPDVLDFGCDNYVYRLHGEGTRDGIVFYAKPHAPRRGFQLGVKALQELHGRRPEVPIHTVGDPDVRLPFPAITHGVCSPRDLSKLYNTMLAGIVLSFTNLSLLPEELLACGAVPVVNDSFDFRADVASKHVRWAPPTASGIAEELVNVVDYPPDPALVARSCREGWRPAQAAFVRALESQTYTDNGVRPAIPTPR